LRLAVIQHERATGLGRFRGLLRERGVDYTILPSASPLDLAGSDGVLALGGSLSADDARLAAARESLREAVLDGMPYLGVCLGGQLLASALGAPVKRAGAEAGIHDVFLTDAARSDPVFAGLPGKIEVFGWHTDSFDLPRGAVPLAGSLTCAFQAFRYGRTAYGVQFHPEVRVDDVLVWQNVSGYRSLLEQSERTWSSVLTELHRAGEGLDELAAHLLDRWLGLVCRLAVRSAA
jgi:GMP synthase-like glutamine amidotransferase